VYKQQIKTALFYASVR